MEPRSNLNMNKVLWCFWLSRQLLVSTLPGTFSSLPAMLPCMTLTRLSFHNLESDSPTSSTTERETIVHGVILSVCWCAQLPLRFAAFLLSFSRGWKKLEEDILTNRHNMAIFFFWLWLLESRALKQGHAKRAVDDYAWIAFREKLLR